MLQIKFFYSVIFSIVLLAFALPCESAEKEQLPIVLVSIAPYKCFVDEIAEGTVQVKMMVPTGGSPHSYEPTVRQILEASKAKIWFIIGESFEERAIQALKNTQSGMKIVDMREGVDLISGEGHQHCSHHHHYDPHIWLSPQLVKKQAITISNALTAAFPQYADIYRKNLITFQAKLDTLNKEIDTSLQSMKNRAILVSHPAFAYYCRDYELKQISIEFEGKEPSPRHLTNILDVARQSRSPVVYIQSQHPSKGAKLVANEIKAKIVEVDPLAENYFENIRNMTRSFAAQ